MTSQLPQDYLTKQDLLDVVKELKTEIRGFRGEWKTDLQEVKGEMRAEWKADLQTLKEEIMAEVKCIMTEFSAKMAFKFVESELRMEDKMRKYHSDILSRFDSWAGTLDKANEFRILQGNDVSVLCDKTNDHEERIKKLEEKIN